MSHRIKKTTDIEGLTIYVPQYKRFFVYWDYWEMSFPPNRIAFRTYAWAKDFIKLQKSKPKDEYYEL
jgi:hypothetical protein